jgi:hypothetical protein
VPPLGLGATVIPDPGHFKPYLLITRAPESGSRGVLQETVMSRIPVRPFLVTKDEEGVFRVTVRTTRFNSQGYPLVSSEVLEDAFRTQTAARTFVRETYRVESSEIATK